MLTSTDVDSAKALAAVLSRHFAENSVGTVSTEENTVVTTGSPNYDGYGTDQYGGDGVTTAQRGATATEPYTVTLAGDVVIRADSQEELDNFIAWLSNMAGKPVDELTPEEVFKYVKLNELSNHFVAHDPSTGDTFTSYALKDSRWAEIETFDQTHFFGEGIPEFPPGSGGFFGATLDIAGDEIQLGLTLGGLSGTAIMIYNANYPAGTPVSTEGMDSLDPEVQKMLELVFGPNIIFTQEHLNVLKMMNLISGTVDGGPSSWEVTPYTGQAFLAAHETEARDFVPAASLFNFDSADISTGKAVAGFFDESGNFINGFGVEHVEKEAAKLLEEISPASAQPPIETPLPSNIVMGDRVANTLNTLFNLPPDNTSFTAEQVNVAILMGLVNYDIATGMLTLTTEGRGYVLTKDPDGLDPAGSVEATANGGELTEEENLQLLWNDWNVLNQDSDADGDGKGDGKGDGLQMADYLESKYKDDDGRTGTAGNGQFGRHGVSVLANPEIIDVYSVEWDEAGLGHLSYAERQEIIDAARGLEENPMYIETWAVMSGSMGGDNIVSTAVSITQVDTWLNNTAHTWKPDKEAVIARYNDPNVTLPPDSADFYMPNNIGPGSFSDEEWEGMNKICFELFGKSFDQMTQEERKKALYVMSTSVPPMIVLGRTTDPDDQIFVKTDGDKGHWAPNLTVDFTNYGSEYANSITY